MRAAIRTAFSCIVGTVDTKNSLVPLDVAGTAGVTAGERESTTVGSAWDARGGHRQGLGRWIVNPGALIEKLSYGTLGGKRKKHADGNRNGVIPSIGILRDQVGAVDHSIRRQDR